MKINPNKINENLVVLITIEIITFLLSINIDSALPFLVWFLIVFILNTIAVYLLIKHKPKYYKTSASILLLLFFLTALVVIFAIAFSQLYHHIENN